MEGNSLSIFATISFLKFPIHQRNLLSTSKRHQSMVIVSHPLPNHIHYSVLPLCVTRHSRGQLSNTKTDSKIPLQSSYQPSYTNYKLQNPRSWKEYHSQQLEWIQSLTKKSLSPVLVHIIKYSSNYLYRWIKKRKKNWWKLDHRSRMQYPCYLRIQSQLRSGLRNQFLSSRGLRLSFTYFICPPIIQILPRPS